MNEWNKVYPKPDWSGHEPQQNFNRQFLPEIDMGWKLAIFNDGRPATIEYWFDLDMRLDCQTVCYSTIGIENWSETDHVNYLRMNGDLKESYPVPNLAMKRLKDHAGNDIWTASEVIADVKD